MGRLDAKVAVITGGASGIGAATVRRFVAEGAQVVIADIQADKGEALAAELGENAIFQPTDVTQEAAIEAMLQRALDDFGRLDVLFNNAGVPGPWEPIEKTPTDAYDLALNVLLRAVMLGMKHAAPILKAQQSGSIISTASVAGLKTGFAGHVYSAAKAGVIQLTRSVAMELGEHWVRVNAICPGGIATPIFGRAFGMDVAQADQTVTTVDAIMKRAQPIPRTGQPDDIANAALFLASDESNYITGHALVVDGGVTGGRLWSESQHGFGRMENILKGQS